MFLAFSHSAFPEELTGGQAIASETSLKISMPISCYGSSNETQDEP